MPTPLEDIIEELQFLSDRISTQVRTIAVSLVVLVWALLMGGKDAPFTPSAVERSRLLAVAVLAIAAMFADYLQYFFGYLSADSTRKTAEAAPSKSADYKYDDPRYQLRGGLFWGKQLLLVIAVVLFAILAVLRIQALGESAA
jgi:hypothetical protein